MSWLPEKWPNMVQMPYNARAVEVKIAGCPQVGFEEISEKPVSGQVSGCQVPLSMMPKVFECLKPPTVRRITYAKGTGDL